jgi:CubicO group peptidase (beta-lactamase class C family)
MVRCFSVLIAMLGLLLGCDSETTTPDIPELPPVDSALYWPSATEWRRADPSQVGFDAERLAALVQAMRTNSIPGLHSLIIVRHGYVAVEEYFNGSLASDVHGMWSVSKSVTSLVTGIAIGEGKLATTTRVFDLMPAYDSLIRGDERKRAITVGHLLQMRAGIDFYEWPYPGSPLERLNESQDDWVSIALGEPMNAAPGEVWQYNTGGVVVLAAAVQAATGVPFATYAREKLFQPLGITTETWMQSPYNGLPQTGGGLHLRAMDLARVGYLVLRNGRWNGTSVVPESWIVESTRSHTSGPPPFFGDYATDYGLLWWRIPAGNAQGDVMVAASGILNQWIFIIPRLDLVITVTGGSDEASAPDFVIREILPSVVRYD